MNQRIAYILTGVALLACGILALYEVRRHGLPRYPTGDFVVDMLTQRPDLMIPALAGVIACGIGIQLVNVAVLRPSTPLRRIISAVLFVGILAFSVCVGACGLIGWITFVQHDSPADDFAAMVIFPRALQTLLGLGIALGMLLWAVIEFAEITLFARFGGEGLQSSASE